MSEKKDKECCPKFDPKPWQDKELSWNEKKFIKDNVTCIFHIPLNMGSVITRMWKKVEAANAKSDDKDFLLLSKDTSPWKSEQYMAVSKKVPDAENTTISGKFITKVFEGPYNMAPKWIEEMRKHVEKKKKELKDVYLFYTTCPKCAKKYGKNYVVVFAKI